MRPRSESKPTSNADGAALRKGLTGRALTVAIFGVIAFLTFGYQMAPKTVRLVGTIDLPGKGGYVDCLVADPDRAVLYAGYASENAMVVVDTRKNSIVTSIEGLNNVRSIALVPEMKLGFTSNRGEDSIGVIDLKTNRLLRKVGNGPGPDAIVYDSAASLVYVANHEGRSATLIDPAAQNVIAVVALGGAAEHAQADPVTGLVYQNLEDRNELAVVDPKKKAVVARYPVGPGSEPAGLALDAVNHRLFCVCGNGKLVVLDSMNGKVVTVLPIGSGADFVAYDESQRRVYTANGGSGTMTVISQETPDRYVVLENVPTSKGAHALAVDRASHRIYVVSGNRITIYQSLETGRQATLFALPHFLHNFSAFS